MFSLTRPRHFIPLLAMTLLLVCAPPIAAQNTDEFSDEAADPVKLFNLGQDAQSKKDYAAALEFYGQALKVRPEFPEAEYQKAGTLVALGREAEAEKSYRRAMELRQTWALPPAALGVLLSRDKIHAGEAETLLRRALELDPKNFPALAALADLRARSGDARTALDLWRRATEINDHEAALWLARGEAERATKDTAAALKSFGRALAIDPSNVTAHVRLAETYLASGDKAHAFAEARSLEAASKTDAQIALALANFYFLTGHEEDGRRVFAALPEAAKNSPDGQKLSAAMNARCEDTPESRAALEKLLESEPRNASALACLGHIYRVTDAQRSADLYKRAAEVEPREVSHAVGYGAALVQLRQFAAAATILQRVISVAPDDYAAHANLATALFELKLYKDALVEYKWLNGARPDLAIVYFFIGNAHDRLGEYANALAAYETFLAHADARANEEDIGKVNLRLPSLRNQIKRGEGVKPRKKNL